jgi:hypothetical protein
MNQQSSHLRILPFAWIMLLAFQPRIHAQQSDIQSKIDPALLQARTFQQQLPSVPFSAIETYAPGKKLPPSVGQVVGILVKARRDTRATIRGLGGAVGSQHGQIVTAYLPLNAIEQLASDDAVEYIEASRFLYNDLDLSVPKTGADVLQSQLDPSLQLTGKGVIIGFTDSGIDIFHPSLRTLNGRTRILYVWDQYATGSPPAGFSYGAEFDSSRINAGTANITIGDHGTHTSGIAAGSGLPAQTYVGMAPEADIIMVVNYGDDLFNRGQTTVGTLDGYDYIRAKANALAKRFVINTSQGTNLGPHDGTTLFEQAMDADVAAGAINVLSAGNEATSARHASAIVSTSTAREIEFSLSGSTTYVIPLDVWYETSDQMQLEIKKSSAGSYSSPVIPNSSQTFYFDSVTVAITSITNSPLNNDNEIYLTVTVNTFISPTVPYRMKLRFSAYGGNTLPAGGRVDLWWERNWAVQFLTNVDQSITLGIPAGCDSVIVVASYNNRDIGYGLTEDISSFSGRGPRRDGMLKPDIAGIGGGVISAYPPSTYAMMSGTSMSSPHVAGAVALLLQKNPTWTSAQVKQRLLSTAVSDGFTGSVPNPTWGYGKLNVLNAVGYSGTFPRAPNFTSAVLSGNNAILTWSDPTQNIDGSTLSNLSKIYVYRNGILIDSVNAGVQTYTNFSMPLGRNYYYLVGRTTANRSSAKSITQGVTYFVKTADLLVVDDDGGSNYDSYYTNSLTDVNRSHDLWNTSTLGEVTGTFLLQYNTATGGVVWLTGDDYTTTLTSSEQASLKSYLDAGGKLFISGQDIGYDLYAFGSTDDRNFYQNYLKAAYVQDDVALNGVRGTTSEIYSGLQFKISGGTGANNQAFPDEVNPVSPAVQVLVYDPSISGALSSTEYRGGRVGSGVESGVISSGTAGLRYQNGNSKVVYFAFGFEAIDTQTNRDSVMARTLRWLGLPIVPPSITVSPDSFHVTLSEGDTTSRTLVIQNTGAGPLNWKISEFDLTESSAFSVQAIGGRADWSRSQEIASGQSADSTVTLWGLHSEIRLISTSTSSRTKILLLSNEDNTLIYSAKNALVSTGVFGDSEIDIINAPTALNLSDLESYRAILVWTDFNFSDPRGIGDVLKQYVDQGGGVVLSTYAYSQNWAIQGGILDGGYSPFLPGPQMAVSGVINLGSLTTPNHPLFRNIYNSPSYWSNLNYSNPSLNGGGRLLASDTQGNNVVAENPNGKVVGIVIFPGRLDAGNAEARQLIANALEYVSSPDWISVDPTGGTVAPGATQSVSVRFNGSNVDGGANGTTYRSALLISHNDPAKDTVRVPAALVVNPDNVPPGAISDLSVFQTSATTATLVWTAPGDNGNQGVASKYDLRYSTSPITEGNFTSAARDTNVVLPVSAGTRQSYTIKGLTNNTPYYFAIKTLDEVPLISAISNVPSGATHSVMRVSVVSILPTYSNNNDGVLNPGEFFYLQNRVFNGTAQNLTGVYAKIDTTYDPMLYPFHYNRLFYFYYGYGDIAAGDSSGIGYSPTLVVSSRAPSGYVLRLPFMIYDNTNTLVGTDTVRLTVTGSDPAAPYIGSNNIVPHYTPVGSPATVYVYLYEGGPVTSIADTIWRADNQTVAGIVTLYDDGTHGDNFAGDHIYYGQFTPNVQADFGMTVAAIDSLGNRGYLNRKGEKIMTSIPFAVNNTQQLVVDAVEGQIVQSSLDRYTQTLGRLGKSYDVWRSYYYGNPDTSVLNRYANVLYYRVDISAPNSTDQTNLMRYMDRGGRLFLAGQGIVQNTSGTTFANNYLHASIRTSYANYSSVVGKAGDPISANLDLTLTGGDGYYYYPYYYNAEVDPITSDLAAQVDTVYKITASSLGGAAVRVGKSPYRLVYLAFPFEAISTAANRDSVMARSLRWLSTPFIPGSIAVSPDSFRVTLSEGDTSAETMKIKNNGAGSLTYSISDRELGSSGTGSSLSVPQVVEALRLRARPPDSSASQAGQSFDRNSFKPNDVATTVFTNSVAPQGGNVAVLGAQEPVWLADVRDKIAGTGLFSSVTAVDVRSVTPTLQDLLAFRSVLVFSNYCFANSTEMGNVLADYVDQGGGVVVAAVWAITEPSGSCDGIAGRFSTENYFAIPQGSYATSGSSSLGTVYMPSHPIMQGIQSFNGGSAALRPYSSDLVPGATRIADWADGRPLVAERTINGHRRIDLGLFPPSSSVYSGGWLSSTDGGRLMANALLYVVGTQWLSYTPVSGVLAANDSVSVSVKLDARIVDGGASGTTYRSTLLVSHNDPTKDTVRVPATLVVSPDNVPPSAISDLSVFQTSATTATLIWTASGDNGNQGVASKYDLRYSTSLITDANFTSAPRDTNVVLPVSAGTRQSCTIKGLTNNIPYYFAIKTLDEVPLTSAISNVPSGTTHSVMRVSIVSIQPVYSNNNDGVLNPGEFFVLQHRIFNGTAQDLTGVYAVIDTSYDPMLYPFHYNRQFHFNFYYGNIAAGDSTGNQYSQVLVVSSRAPSAYVLRLPFKFYDNTGTLVGTDTVRLTVTGSDQAAPYIGTNDVVPHYTPVGSPATVYVYLYEGGPVTSIADTIWRTDNQTAAGIVTLYDDGTHGDNLAGDHIYYGQFTPFVQAEFGMTMAAADSLGNRGYLNRKVEKIMTSVPFTTANTEHLVVDADAFVTYGPDFNTAPPLERYKATLSRIGKAFDSWRSYYYGSPDTSVLNRYQNVIYFWVDPWNPIASADQTNLMRYLEKGGRLVINGQSILQLTTGTAFAQNYLHASIRSGEANYSSVVGKSGDPISGNLDLALSGGDGYNAYGNFYNDEVNPITSDLAAQVDTVYKITSSSLGATALRVAKYPYRLVYLGFPFEAISTAANRDSLMMRSLRWLDLPAGPSPPPASWAFKDGTGKNATIFVPTTINPSTGTRPLQSGDAVGVFFLRNDSMICAGYSLWQEGQSMGITAWGDDDQTALKDGFAEGEFIHYKIWDALAAREYNAVVTYSSGDSLYVSDGIYFLGSLVGITTISHSIILPQGWNMNSSFVAPRDSTLDTMMVKINSHLVLMKNGAGQIYTPLFGGINTIGKWNPRHGYKIYMSAADTVTITGIELHPESTPLQLAQGWNLSAYLRNSPMGADSALAGIVSNVVVVKNNAGQIYTPLFGGINTIGQMKSGQGYQMYLTQASTLTYPANTSPTPPSMLTKRSVIAGTVGVSSPVHYTSSVSNTGANAVLILESSELKEGDEIGVWTEKKMLVGSGVVNQGRAVITIWGDNSITEDIIDGAMEGESLSLTMWSVEEKKETPLSISSLQDALTGKQVENVLRYETDDVWIAQGVNVATEIPTTFSLSQNYPNPFNPSTTIKYGLPKDVKVTLEVYNILGQRVGQLVNEEQKAGYYEVLFQNSNLASGAYFYRLSAGEFIQTKKLMLVR